MFKNELGQIIEHEQAIIPLISFNKGRHSFRCLGTAFVVNGAGIFVTAKHVLFDNNDQLFNQIMGIQTLSNKTHVMRELSHLSIHPSADIAMGRFEDEALDGNANPVPYELFHTFKLSFNKMETNDKIIAFGYPRAEKIVIENNTTFNITGLWSEGIINDFCPEGSPLLKNKCYQTSMHIDSGASGGPVFKNNVVVGINSTGWSLEQDSEPISYITPIDYIKDLEFDVEGFGSLAVEQIIQDGFIQVQ